MQEEEIKRIRTLLKKHKKFMGSRKKLAKFKQPVVLLMRRGNTVEFFENAKKNEFEFEHSDGHTRSIILNPAHQKSFDYGADTFSGYILHEDIPVPLPEQPLITTEMVGILVEKTLADIRKWKAEEWKARGKFIWYIAGGIALIILAYAMYGLFMPQHAATTAAKVAEVINTSTAIIQ